MDRALLELFAPREDALHDDRPAFAVRGALRKAGSLERLLVGLTSFAGYRRDPMLWVDVPHAERPAFDAVARDRFRSWQHLYGGALDVVRQRGPTGLAFDLEAPGGCPEVEGMHYLPALAGLPDWRWLREQALAFARRLEVEGQTAQAERYLRRAVDEADPGSASLRFALASLVERKGDPSDAIVLYRTVLAFDQDYAAARDALARLGAR